MNQLEYKLPHSSDSSGFSKQCAKASTVYNNLVQWNYENISSGENDLQFYTVFGRLNYQTRCLHNIMYTGVVL